MDKNQNLDVEMAEQLVKLNEENKVLKKALELACERVKYFEEMQDKEIGHYEIFGYDTNYDLKALVDDFIKQAKEGIYEKR